MRADFLKRVLLACVFILLPTLGYAQEATITEAFSFRLREDGSIVPRNGFSGDPVHRVDVRLQQRIPLGGRIAADGIVEIFNLFDRANFGTYVTDELSPLFGQPEFNSNLAYAARTLQLGFRLTF